MSYDLLVMWKKSLTQCVGLVCLLGLSSCDKVQELTGSITGSGESESTERRAGLTKMHDASSSDVREWLAEPNVLVVLDFYSERCPPCLAMMPDLKVMAEKYGDKAAILKLNVGAPGEVADMAMNEYEIEKTPLLKFYLNGEEVKELEGLQSAEELEKVFKRYTGKIEGEFTMRAGDMPGQKSERTVEDMMTPVRKGDLPKGITRAKIPKNAKSVTEGLPENIRNAGAPAPTPTMPAKAK